MSHIQGIWTAKTLEMENCTRNSRTILKLESIRYNTPSRKTNSRLRP